MKLFKALNIASRKVLMNEVFFYQQILVNFLLGHCNALFSLFLCCFSLFDLEMLGKNLQSHKKVTVSFQILVHVPNLEYLCQSSTKHKY